MNEILAVYKNRLINISSKNRSFVCNKLQQKKGFDLTHLNVLDETFATSLVEYLLSNPSKPMVLLSDVTTTYNQTKKEILKSTLKESEEQQAQLAQLDRLLETLMSHEHKLKTLTKELKNVHKETGRNELFVGYPFLEGKLKDGTFFRAPLFLFPISVTFEKSTYYLKRTQDSILLNKVFMLATAQRNEVELKDWDMEYSDLSLDQMNEILARLGELGLLIPNDIVINPVPFKEYTAKTVPTYQNGFNLLVQNLVIGQFPIANTLYKDYEHLMSRSDSHDLLYQLLDTGAEEFTVEYDEPKEEHGKLSFNEQDLYSISNLDFSQELAVRRVERSKQLVIYGPPGTGKSQTLTNIVSNALAKGKRVLVVSQKRAALDVIYNRLGALNEKSILIYDATKDKKSFYEMVTRNIESAEHAYEAEDLTELLTLSTGIDERLGQLERLAETLHRKTSYGLSLQEMYSKSQAIEDRQDERFEDYLHVKSSFSQFELIPYSHLVQEVQCLTEAHLVSYQRVAQEKESCPELDQLDSQLTKLEAEEVVYRLTQLNEEAIQVDSDMKESPLLYEYLCQALHESRDLDEEILTGIAQQVNQELNSALKETLKLEIWRETAYFTTLTFTPAEQQFIASNTPVRKKAVDLAFYENMDRLDTLETCLKQLHPQVALSLPHQRSLLTALKEKQRHASDDTFSLLTLEDRSLIAKQLNEAENGDLLTPLDTKKWWSPAYWKARQSLQQQEVENRRLYAEKEQALLESLNQSWETFVPVLTPLIPLSSFTLTSTPMDWIDVLMTASTSNPVLEAVQREITFTHILRKAQQKEAQHRQQYESHLREWQHQTREAADKLNGLLKKVDHWTPSWVTTTTETLTQTLLEQGSCTPLLAKEIQVYEQFGQLKGDFERLATVSDLGNQILEVALSEQLEDMKKRVAQFVEFNTLLHIAKLEEDPMLREQMRVSEWFNEVTHQIEALMKQKQAGVRRFLATKWSHQFAASLTDKTKEYKEFKRQAQKKRQLMPIRQYVETYPDFVFNLYPCVLSSPEMVSQILPLTKGLFDVVVFDEASQMFIENALPAIYRAKQVVVAGDDKQLKPTSLFKASLTEEVSDDEEVDMDSAAALEEVSLLDLAKVNYDSVYLNYHYRSRFVELINFSNYAFYGGRLKISPNLTEYDTTNPPIECINVKGYWLDRKNIEEAEAIVELVANTLRSRQANETIGIITFNTTQRDLIEDLLERRAQHDKDFQARYIEEINRVKDNEDVSLFVKNIENVQGDERDIIIFSVGYAKNEKGRVSTNFGSLSQEGGENRLNVAISRAKQKIYLVTSISPAELNVENSKNNGPKLFKKYLQYGEAVSSGNLEEAQVILNSVLDSRVAVNSERLHDSDFEAEVYDALVEAGYNVKTQIGVSGYSIDLALYDEKTSRYVLGIECDGALYHSSKSARERDIHRQRYLESRGWKIMRIWSRHWWKNPQAEIERIKREYPLEK